MSSIGLGTILIQPKERKEMCILGPSIKSLNMIFPLENTGKKPSRRLGIPKTLNE